MAELAEERQAVQRALNNYHMYGWLFEKDAGARPELIQQTYLEEVASCDIYLGLFWQGYGQYTIEEFEKARALQKPCLVYEKHVNIEQRDPQLTTFLRSIQQVTDPKGLTVRRFQTAGELAEQVSQDVLHLLITDFRKSRQQPPVWNVPYRRNPFFKRVILILLILAIIAFPAFASLSHIFSTTQVPQLEVPGTPRSGNLLTNGSFEQGTKGWNCTVGMNIQTHREGSES